MTGLIAAAAALAGLGVAAAALAGLGVAAGLTAAVASLRRRTRKARQ